MGKKAMFTSSSKVWIPIFSRALTNSWNSTVPELSRSKKRKFFKRTASSLWKEVDFWRILALISFSKLQRRWVNKLNWEKEDKKKDCNGKKVERDVKRLGAKDYLGRKDAMIWKMYFELFLFCKNKIIIWILKF